MLRSPTGGNQAAVVVFSFTIIFKWDQPPILLWWIGKELRLHIDNDDDDSNTVEETYEGEDVLRYFIIIRKELKENKVYSRTQSKAKWWEPGTWTIVWTTRG